MREIRRISGGIIRRAMTMELQKDANGNIIASPVTGWITGPAAEMYVLVAIQYAETQSDIETGTLKQLQCILLPQEALKLAETLTIQAQRLLGSDPFQKM